MEDVKTAFLREIEFLKEHLNASRCVYCLSDVQNFRTRVLPSYKSHRSSQKRPLALKEIRRWLLEEQEAVMRPGLEGDDILGIFATWPTIKEKSLSVSIKI